MPQTVLLDADSAESVDLGDLAATGFHFIRVESDQELTVTVTSTVGTSSYPAKFLILGSTTTPYTALTLQRPAGVAARAVVYLAQI